MEETPGMLETQPFHENSPLTVPIRDLGLEIKGTWIEPTLRDFEQELRQAGITGVTPRFYLANEWGVSDSLAIVIPFYLARTELMSVHEKRVGYLEGKTHRDILRYLRHEMGHVLCYAYRLFDEEEYVKAFGANTQPYLEEFRVEPFSRR